MAALKLAACSLGGRFAVPSAQLARFPTGRSEEGWPERQRQREREREREGERECVSVCVCERVSV